MNSIANKKTIVLFAPHPDDETLGCGGYLAKKIDEGYEVFVVVLTMGEKLFSAMLNIFENPSPSEICAIRRDESRRATEFLGLKPENLLFLDFEDAMLEKQRDAAIAKVIQILHERKPAEIMCTSQYEAHPDHVSTYWIVRHACEKTGLKIPIRRYIISLKKGLHPSQLPESVESVDITEYLPLKKQAIAQFKAHLGILSPKQTAPIYANFDEYLKPEEQFFL
ncbi:MAG: PIG-L deacetylase family protein [Victivallaceae bacterium]|jgi:LmbE family N-acetylglucosaminyl deacetylase